MSRPHHHLFAVSAVLVLGCTAQPAAESAGARFAPDAQTLTTLHAALSAPGALLPPPFAVDYFSGDEIPEEALSTSVTIVDFAEGEDVAAHARKRITAEIERFRYDEEQDVGEVLFLFDNSDIEWTLQTGTEVEQRILAAVADEALRATVKEVLDDGVSAFRFQAVDDAAELSATEIIIFQPALDDAENRALVIELGCCGGY